MALLLALSVPFVDEVVIANVMTECATASELMSSAVSLMLSWLPLIPYESQIRW